MKKFLLISALSLVVSPSLSFATSVAVSIIHPAEVKSGQTVSINAFFKYEIDNSSQYYQSYVGYEEIEVNGVKNKWPLQFSISAKGKKTGQDNRSMNYKADLKPGRYKIKSAIKIMGYNGTFHESSNTLVVK
jgi:hypothetical protein